MNVWILMTQDWDGDTFIIGVYKTKELAIEGMKDYANRAFETDDLKYNGHSFADKLDTWSYFDDWGETCFSIIEQRVVE